MFSYVLALVLNSSSNTFPSLTHIPRLVLRPGAWDAAIVRQYLPCSSSTLFCIESLFDFDPPTPCWCICVLTMTGSVLSQHGKSAHCSPAYPSIDPSFPQNCNKNKLLVLMGRFRCHRYTRISAEREWEWLLLRVCTVMYLYLIACSCIGSIPHIYDYIEYRHREEYLIRCCGGSRSPCQ